MTVTNLNPQGTGLVLDDSFMRHSALGLPEKPYRIQAVREGLARADLIERCELIIPPETNNLSEKNIALSRMKLVHDEDYIHQFSHAYEDGLTCVSNNPEAPLGEFTFDATWRATASVTSAIDRVMRGEIRNAFCAIRPPGHHAEHAQATGFCYVNHIAVAAAYLREAYGIKRVLMVDVDLHHGNGAQHTFWNDPDFLFCSIQPDPTILRYPGTGASTERGAHDNILNLALPGGTSARNYLKTLETQLLPRAEDFKPEFVLISSGFDTYVKDPLNQGYISLQPDDFGRVAELLLSVANQHCQGRLVSLLEGGYNLDMLGLCAANYVQKLVDAGKAPAKPSRK